MPMPLTLKQALTDGLYLALTAPADEKAAEVAALCDAFASEMTEAEVARCKRAARARFDRFLRTGVF